MKLIETKFPLIEINVVSEYESSFLKAIPKQMRQKLSKLLNIPSAKGINLPKLNNLFYYPARIPPSATRAVSVASLVYDNVDKDTFLNALGLQKLSKHVSSTGYLATLYKVNPDQELIKKLLGVDPLSIVVVDPMAGGGSIPLEAKRLGFTVITGDYNPVSYLLLRATIEFPAKYGRRLYNLVNEEAKKLVNYVKNKLGGYYPQDGKNVILVPAVEHDCGAVVPLIKETALYKGRNEAVHISWILDKNDRRLYFKPSETPPPPLNICPFCGKPISIESLRRKWIQKHKEIIDRLLQGDESAVDEVTKIYNIIAISMSRSKYRAPTQQDEDMLIATARELSRVAKQEDIIEYLPMYPIPEDNDVFNDVRKAGLNFWYYLYTPRQLLVMYNVIKYIKERVKTLKNAYGELGVAIALYLVLGFAKALNYNSILTQWHSERGVIRDLVGSQYALSRKVSLGYDFAEGNLPFFGLEWAFEAEEEELNEEETETTAGGILPVLKLLCESLEGLWYEGRDGIYLWDARELDMRLPQSFADLINVDPPYYDQHDYSGITEFFWVTFMTALRNVLDDLFPKDRVKINWDPYNPEIPKNIEIRGKPPAQVGWTSKFGEDFARFLRACSKVLKPNGLLVVWYAYGKLSGWEELFYRFYETGYTVTKAWQVWTQSAQRRVALHTKAFFTSMVIVARPAKERQLILSVDDPRLESEVSKRVSDSLLFILSNYGVEHLHEALVVSIADGIAAVTLFEIPSIGSLTYVANFRKMLEKALEVATSTILKELMRYSYSKLPEINLDNVSRLYLMLLITSYRDQKSGQLKVSHDFANRLSQVLRTPLESIKVRKPGGGESDILISPEDMIGRSHAISEAIRLIYDIRDRLIQSGIRSAEEYAKEHSSHAPLALTIVILAWDKLGINNINVETIINVLRKAVTQ